MAMTNRIALESLTEIEPRQVDTWDREKCRKVLHDALDNTDLLGMTHQDIDDMDRRNCRDKVKEVVQAAHQALAV
jgi:hypothetical protein